MIFKGLSSAVVFGLSVLVLIEGIQKFRPILRLLQYPRCFNKLMQRGDVYLPQLILLFARSRRWHSSIMQQPLSAMREFEAVDFVFPLF
jgi:hypothetical protein